MARQFVERIKRFLNFLQHDLWRIDLVHDSKLRTFGIETLRVTHLVLKGVKDDNCKLHASALTYATLMALIPFMVILFSIGKAIGFTTAEQEILKYSAANFPEQLQVFVSNLLELVGGIDPAALGGIGGVAFLIIIYKMLSGIEESFNQIWGVKASRGIADKIRNYLAVLVITPSLALVANVASGKITADLASLALQLAPIFVLTLAFVAIFMFLPNTKVNFKSAMTGGFVSALMVVAVQMILISLGRIIFKKFAIYGGLASIPIFLFWMHLNWTILLFGAELAFAIQNRDTYAEEQAAVRASLISKLWVAFSLMQEAVRVFQSSDAAVRAVAYAHDNNIPIRLMNEVVEVLTRARLLGSVAPEGQGNYALLQAPEHVTAKKIYDLMITDGSSPKDLGLIGDAITDEVLSTADISLDETLDPITLRRFMDGE
ncbi:MAG: YihY/virulence factor BrkB family protein [Verrucomicrobiota bacterium]